MRCRCLANAALAPRGIGCPNREGNPGFNDVYPNPNKPAQWVVRDDEPDCYFRGGEDWPFDCFNQGEGTHARFTFAGGNSDGAVFGPLPDRFELAVTIRRALGPHFAGGSAASRFTARSVGFQSSFGYQKVLDINPSTFDEATFLIRGRPRGFLERFLDRFN